MSTPDSNTDAWLDAELCNVPLPEGLLERLRRTAGLSDQELDAALCDVPVPSLLAQRLQRISARQNHRARFQHLAAAAVLLLAIGLSHLGLTLSFVASLRSGATPPTPRLTAQLRLQATEEVETAELDDRDLLVNPDTESLLAPWSPVPELPPQFLAEHIVAAPTRQSAFPTQSDLMLDKTQALWPLGAPIDPGDALEDLRKVAGLKPRGIDFPLVHGYDIAFLSRTGFHPFVSPAANSQLRSLVVPLGIDTESYDLAHRYLEDGELPPRTELRTEEFLAAIDYQYPRPSQQALGLFAAGGPSPFHANGMQLLQLGVQAKRIPSTNRSPTRLTLVVDASGSMSWGGRMEMIRHALHRLTGHLTAQDRVSVVVFSDQSYALIEDASRAQREQLLTAIEALPTEGPTNVAAGLRMAYTLAQRETSSSLKQSGGAFDRGPGGLDEATAVQIDQR